MGSILATIGKVSSLMTNLKGLVVANKQTVISNLVIDCVHDETIELRNVLTEHPISSRSNVGDHIYNESDKVIINGTITDTSMKIFGIIETPLQKNTFTSMLKNARSLLPFSNVEKPSQAAFNILYDLSKNKQLVTVVCKRKVFKNMAIESISFKDDESTVHRLRFTCTLSQFSYASVAQTSNIAINSISKALNSYQKPSAATLIDTTNKGLVQPTQTDNSSIGAKILDFFTGDSPADARANENISTMDGLLGVGGF